MIQRTEVDGVPTFLAARPGPLTAGLLFRVGPADETLATRGITRLVGELAAPATGPTDRAVPAAFTLFQVSGDETGIIRYLTGVCAALADLPVDRLTDPPGPVAEAEPDLAWWRYGARGYGLAGALEWGRHRVTGEELRAWAATRFTRANAALWITGDRVPAGLALPLPPGRRHPVPVAGDPVPPLPGYLTGAGAHTVLDTVVPESPAGRALAALLHGDRVPTSYQPRLDGYATLTATLDATDAAGLGELLDLLARLRVAGPAEPELARYRAGALAALEHPEAEAGLLPDAALAELAGRRCPILAELRAELADLTVAQVEAAARIAAAQAMLRVPPGTEPEWAGFSPVPAGSAGSVAGEPVNPVDEVDEQLVIGADGISRLTATGPHTVRYADCAAQLRWPDGACRFVGPDGVTVAVEPTRWQLTAAHLAQLDARVPAQVVVELPARPAERVPQPDPRPRRSRRSPAPRVAWTPVEPQPERTEAQLWAATRAARQEADERRRELRRERNQRRRRALQGQGGVLFTGCTLVVITFSRFSLLAPFLLVAVVLGGLYLVRGFLRYHRER